MNDLSLPVRSTDHDEQHLLRVVLSPDTRVTALDRLSLRVGMWLLLRSARPARRRGRHVDRALLLEQQHLAREREREAAWARIARPPFL